MITINIVTWWIVLEEIQLMAKFCFHRFNLYKMTKISDEYNTCMAVIRIVYAQKEHEYMPTKKYESTITLYMSLYIVLAKISRNSRQ